MLDKKKHNHGQKINRTGNKNVKVTSPVKLLGI